MLACVVHFKRKRVVFFRAFFFLLLLSSFSCVLPSRGTLQIFRVLLSAGTRSSALSTLSARLQPLAWPPSLLLLSLFLSFRISRSLSRFRVRCLRTRATDRANLGGPLTPVSSPLALASFALPLFFFFFSLSLLSLLLLSLLRFLCRALFLRITADCLR